MRNTHAISGPAFLHINPKIFIGMIVIIILLGSGVYAFQGQSQTEQPTVISFATQLNGIQALETRITLQHHTMIFINTPNGECGFEVFKKHRLLTPENNLEACTPEKALQWLKDNKTKLSIPERVIQYFSEHITAVTGVSLP